MRTQTHDGLLIGFRFNQLEKDNKKLLSFNDKAPKYLYVCYGLNLQAVCNTQSCEAFGKKVWIQKGFGVYNIGREINRCICPICKEKTKPAFNIGYYNTVIKVEGKQKDCDDEISWE